MAKDFDIDKAAKAIVDKIYEKDVIVEADDKELDKICDIFGVTDDGEINDLLESGVS